MSEWREASLGDVCELKRGYDLPTKRRRPGCVPIVSSSGPTGFHDEARVKGPGVVTGRYGTLGQVFYVTEDFWPLNTSLYVRDFKGNNPRYVAGLLSSLNLGRYDGAAAVPGLNRNQLHTIPVRLPNADTQRRISLILASFDDLIENNRRRNELLESMARAIYCEWFVHFRFPGHENVPMVDSDLGPIPEGWHSVQVSKVARVIRGRSYRKFELVEEGGLPFVNLKCMARGGGFRAGGLKRYKGDYKADQLVTTGDIVLAVTDLTQGREILAQATMIPRIPGGKGVISLDVARLDPFDERDRYWIFGALRWSDFADRIKEYANGSTVLHLSPTHLEEAQILWPQDEYRMALTKAISPLLTQVDSLEDTSRTLTSLRDLLLPKLVTGQIDVSTLDLDAVIHEAVA